MIDTLFVPCMFYTTFGAMTLSRMTISRMTVSRMTVSRMTFEQKSDTQHNKYFEHNGTQNNDTT
jgi:hypothetical protein